MVKPNIVILGGGFGGSGPRPPGAGGGGPGGRGFGPGNFLGPSFTKSADADGNGQVTGAEFETMASRWFAEWGGNENEALTPEQMRAGLSKAFAMPAFGAPPGPR